MTLSWRKIVGTGAALTVAATVLVQIQLSSPAAAATVCNKFCDVRDPALSPVDRLSATVTVAGRQLALHFDDTDAMVWVTMQTGQPGDTFWLDRSFDGGRTSSDSRLGTGAIPAGVTGWRGAMYNVDNWAARGVGAVRGCGQPAGSASIACTAWARTTWNAADRLSAATTALMMTYNNGTGLFNTTGWWNSANALTALIENSRITGLAGYRYAIANTYDKQVNSFLGQFRNDFIDDTGWWGLAWIAAYDLTNDVRYLNTARADADYMHTFWDTGCGGVFWRTSRTGKTAIANSLYLQLNSALGRRVAGDTTYRARATASWNWWKASGLVNGEGLVNDSVDNTTCRNANTTIWTYNSGNAVNGFVEYNRLTNDADALASARKVGTAMTTSTRFNSGGVFREQCEPGCSGDANGASFKGAAVRGVMQLNYRTNGAYTTWLQQQANSMFSRNRNRLDQYGFHWAGPLDSSDAARQHSALDLLNAAA
ncbi:MAG: hypothetical protein QOI52_2004 [Chloroflexota bacterium]|nr:hypothetical protein [Chloroflexota bacterium]